MDKMKDGIEFSNRQNYMRRYNPSSKFSRRLRTHDRPVRTAENLLEPDNPSDQFTTTKRP